MLLCKFRHYGKLKLQHGDINDSCKLQCLTWWSKIRKFFSRGKSQSFLFHLTTILKDLSYHMTVLLSTIWNPGSAKTSCKTAPTADLRTTALWVTPVAILPELKFTSSLSTVLHHLLPSQPSMFTGLLVGLLQNSTSQQKTNTTNKTTKNKTCLAT